MTLTLHGFKKFIIEDMDPTPEGSRDVAMGNQEKEGGSTTDYFGALGEEQGIEWNELVKILENEPWISSHFGLGEINYKQSAWEIVKGSLTPNGADIRLKPQKGNRSYLQGNRLNKSKYEDKNRYHLGRKELISFLTTGWTPAIQAAGAAGGADPMGGMGGMPPM